MENLILLSPVAALVAVIIIGFTPNKKKDVKKKPAQKNNEGDLYIKHGGKFYKVIEVTEDKKQEKKERHPLAWRW